MITAIITTIIIVTIITTVIIIFFQPVCLEIMRKAYQPPQENEQTRLQKTPNTLPALSFLTNYQLSKHTF